MQYSKLFGTHLGELRVIIFLDLIFDYELLGSHGPANSKFNNKTMGVVVVHARGLAISKKPQTVVDAVNELLFGLDRLDVEEVVDGVVQLSSQPV